MSLSVAIVGACPYPVPQGSQVFLRQTAEALQSRGHRPRLVVYGYGIGEDSSGLPVHRAGEVRGAAKTAAGPSWAKPLLDLALVAALRRVVREQHIDVVYAHNYEGLFVALAARARPVVYQAHNAMADELPYYFGGSRLAGRFGAWLDRSLPRRAGQVVVPHAALAEYLIACGCRPARMTCLAPPVKADTFSVGERGHGIPPVLYTGNLDAYQNLGFLQPVMEKVRRRCPEVRLVVATAAQGDVPGAEMVRTPDFASLRTVLAQDAVVVCPRVSWSGYPIKTLNAMAAGKPVVACRSAAHALADGHTGLVVDDNDETAFADAVVRLLMEPCLRRELGSNARKTVLENHRPEDYASGLEEVFQKALRSRA